jgi:hypothetical protein
MLAATEWIPDPRCSISCRFARTTIRAAAYGMTPLTILQRSQLPETPLLLSGLQFAFTVPTTPEC